MKLSTLYTTVPDYIEFGWVTAPNAAGQSITANTITTLTLDTEVTDTGALVSAPTSNRFTLPVGTYYFEAYTPFRQGSSSSNAGGILSLYNHSDSSYVSRSTKCAGHTVYNAVFEISGQFVISSSKTFELRFASPIAGSIVSGAFSPFTDSTASADQRTTIKLWKLK